MKRATALKVLAATLTLLTVAAAVPLALLLPEDDAATARSSSSPFSPTPGAATPGLPFGPAGNPDAETPAAASGGPGGTSSRPGPAGGAARGTGSAVLDQVLGAARLMGVDVEVPDLPLHRLEPVNPLRAAIVGWIAVTGAQVPPEELAQELARADALPDHVQRDVALLVLAATDAVVLQREATAILTPEQLAWIHAHPEIATALARGDDTVETRQLAALSQLVDVKKSIEASLVLLTAVEATRGSLASAETRDALALLDDSPDLDPATQAVLRVLATAGAQRTDAEKVAFAARLVAVTSGATPPSAVEAASFADAVARLTAATGQTPDADELSRVLARADALPEDLERALASIILAQALAVEAAAPSVATTEAQGEAMARVLLTVAQALPVLEKHSLYWRHAPDALRVGQWSPETRLGWALEHAAYFTTTRGDAADAARAAMLLHGTPLQQVEVPERSFVDAYLAISAAIGDEVNASMVDEVRRAESALDPRVARAAAILLSGAAESARLHREAFAALTPEQRVALLTAEPMDDAFLSDAADVQALADLAALAAKVDRVALAKSQLVAVKAVEQAREILEPIATQGDARPVRTGLLGLLQRLAPWQTARAQAPACVQLPNGLSVVKNDCRNDVLLVVNRVSLFGSGGFDCVSGGTMRTTSGVLFATQGCADRGATLELLVITGGKSSRMEPSTRFVAVPPPGCAEPCFDSVFLPLTAYGAPAVHLDLGGDDTYARPVAMTYPTTDVPVSLHLDMGGSDDYQDPSLAYGERTILFNYIGRRVGHPTQGSALGGGVAILYDNWRTEDTQDRYQAPALSQGYGQWGLGLLVDTGGDDAYTALAYAQGVAGRDFNIGAGVLLDLAGDDRYRATSGQGYGTGGVLVDLAGSDVYANDAPATGVPMVHLKEVPGGNLTTLHERRDNRFWLAGPYDFNLGLGVDTETSISSENTDGDLFLYSDFVETVFGTDPYDRDDSPQTRPTAQAEKLVVDSDLDGYPDFIERALSTNPRDNRSMPLSLPVGPSFVAPAPLGEVSPGRQAQNVAPLGAKGSDKILDLRVPLQDAGTIDFGCTGPLGFLPGGNAMNLSVRGFTTRDPNDQAPVTDGPCVIVGYEPEGSGEATVASPGVSARGGSNGGPNGDTTFQNRTFHYPPGILAIGDAVSTTYDVDYFLVVDLGGDDVFLNAAGGGLVVKRTNPTTKATTDSFVAPSLVLNLDVSGRTVPTGAGTEVRSPDRALGHDRYGIPANATSTDFMQGSLWGILLDTQGDDRYTAGGASQGSLGGLLLDLEGSDVYQADDLSQGATLGTIPTQAQRDRQPGLPANPPADKANDGSSDTGTLRRAPPGLHLDFGTGNDIRKVRNASQGFARGFSTSAPPSVGLLFDQGGHDQYLARSSHGRGTHVQGVATMGGLGILYDAKGNDTYTAWGVVSQGASVSSSYGAAESAGDRGAPGAALLLDTGGGDVYEYANLLGAHNRTEIRQDRLTLERAETLRGSNRYHVEPSIHYDGEDVSLNAVLGTGRQGFTSVDPASPTATNVNDFYVNIPAARLAIGGPKPTTYAHDYAFIVDLGGSNLYETNAGGLVTAVLAKQDNAQSGSGYDTPLGLFPVSFVLDAGTDASVYKAAHGLVQGAGFFSVGVLVDLGGNDAFVALPRAIPSLGASWARVLPTIDGSVEEPAWTAVPARTLTLVDLNDTRFAHNLTLRVQNDERNVYFAIEGVTPSKRGLAENDLVRIDLNPGRTLAPRPGAEIDAAIVRLGTNGLCELMDGLLNTTLSPPRMAHDWGTVDRPNVHGRAACAYRADGSFVMEIEKPLRPGLPRDEQDLDLPYSEKSGFRKDDAQMGFRIGWIPGGVTDELAWPPLSVRTDGEGPYPRNGDLKEEIAEWASFALASQGVAGVPANVTRSPALSQGAAISGVGILAHLGTLDSSNTYVASDRAQGYAAYQGLALLVDAGGSDAYSATTEAQGFAEKSAFAALVDAEGNDNYRSVRNALGATPPTNEASAMFVDLGGIDRYDTAVRASDRDAAAKDAVARDAQVYSGLGTATVWRTGGGVGFDYMSQDNLRGALRGLYAGQWFGVTRTTLSVLRTDEAGTACTTPSRETVEGEERVVASGIVCLRAVVDLTTGADPRPGNAFSVDAVDFVVGGIRVATVNASVHNWTRDGRSFVETGPGTYVATIRLDTRGFEDGPAAMSAVTLVRASTDATVAGVKTGERGVVLFYDQATEGNRGALVPALINNPTETSLKLWPEFDGGADAIFSPRSQMPGKDRLQIDWSATHDSGEDRYGLRHGWTAPPELSNVPCKANATRLCDLLPFYLRTGGAFVDTEPVEILPLSPDGQYNQREGDNPYIQKIPALETPLKLYKKDAFHLHLNTHRAILDGNYTTTIRLVLTQGSGDKITAYNETNVEVPVVLAERTVMSRQNLGVGQLTEQVPGGFGGLRREIDQKVLDATGMLGSGDVLTGAARELHQNCRSSTAEETALLWTLLSPNGREGVMVESCGQFYGYVGYGSARPCQRVNDAVVGIPRMVLTLLHEAMRDGPVCKPTLMDRLNETAVAADEETSDYVSIVGPAVSTATATLLAPPDPNPLHWLDFFVDAEQPRYRPDGMPPLPEDEETITIPPGYGVMMEMYIRSDGTPVDASVHGHWRNVIDTILHPPGLPEFPRNVVASNPTAQGAVATANAETNKTPRGGQCFQCSADNTWQNTVYNSLAVQRDESSSVGAAIDRFLNNPIPIAYFNYGDGQSATGRQLPARLMVRVPTEPTTSVDISIEDPLTGEKVATLVNGARVVGDIAGSPTLVGRQFLQRFETWEDNSTGTPVNRTELVEEHAVYKPAVRAYNGPSGGPTDDSLRFTQNRYNFSGLLPGGATLPDGVWRVNVTTWDDSTAVPSTKTGTFLLDSRAPITSVASRAMGALHMENSALPIDWSFVDEGSGAERTWVMYRIGNGEWKHATVAPGPFDPVRDAFPATTTRYLFQNLGRATEYSFVTIGQDRAGNLEFDPQNGTTLPLKDRVYWAAMGKVAQNQHATITLDQALPGVRGDGIDGARLVSFQGGEFTFVKAGSPVTFRACARDSDGSDVSLVQFTLSYLGGNGTPLTRTFASTSPAGRCADGSGLWTYSGWGDVNTNKTVYPDGVWSVAVKALDRASNEVNVGMGAVILDSEAPRIRLDPPVFPPGQSAVKPGDRLTIRLLAQDAFGVNDGGIRIDASALTKQGPLSTRPVRISGVTMQEATLTVDRSELRNGAYNVTIVVPDNAGNVNSTQLTIPVDFKTFVIPPESVRITNVTHNSLVVTWTTTEPTTSQVRFGTGPSEIRLRTPLNATLTTEHAVKVDGLSPSTRYFLRAVSSTAGGYVNESETLDAATGSALFLEPLGPAAGSALRGPVEVRFKGGLLDADEPVTFTLEAQAEPDAPWLFVTTTTEPGDEHVLVFNTTRYLDAPEYRLRIKAESGKDVASVTLGPFLSDNTPPRLTVVGPLVATNDTTPRLVAEAEDALARFGTDAATLLVDGKSVDGVQLDTRGDILAVAYDVSEPLTAGPHKFELRVQDRAGNVATESWTVSVDGEAPVVTTNPVSYAPGRAAAKLGGTATLNVTVKDASGVQSVLADTHGISSQASTRLARVSGTDHYVGTFPVTDASPDATHRVAVTATDLAGNAQRVTVEVPVDNVAPVVGEARTMDLTQTRATLVADANEPVILVGTFTAPRAPPVQAAGDKLSTRATLALEGLLPSRTYLYSVQAMDRAGNSVELSGRFQTALDTQAPGEVTGLSILDLLNGTLRLTWAPATDDVGIAFYRVYRSEDGGASFRPVAEVQDTSYLDARLPLETTFTYQVFAVDHGGNEGGGSERLAAAATAVPRLIDGSVTPTVGSTATVFRYVVTYVSPGGVVPAYVRVVLDGVPQEMTLQPGGSPETGLVYAYETRLSPHRRDAPHTYSFEASDGRYAVRFPDAGEPLRGPLVSGDASPDGALEGAAAFAKRVPLVGAAGSTLALVAAAAAVVVLRRRNKP